MQRGWQAARLSWRIFWSRRSRVRIRLGLAIIAFALLISAYAMLPAGLLAALNGAIGSGISYLASLRGEQALAVVWAVLFALLGLFFIFTPRFQRYPNLTTALESIPRVSVYVDAENQLRTEEEIRAFLGELYKAFPRERVDLMFFMDSSNRRASSTPENQGKKDVYKLLYLSGFRPVDVPHNPTGVRDLKEAVDHEIAMYALERALLGPAHQTFILVTGDGDYLPLVFRLVALKHTVHIWASANLSGHYREIKAYLPITVLNLASVLAAGRTSSVPDVAPDMSPPPAASPAPAGTRVQTGRGTHRRRRKRPRRPILLRNTTAGWQPDPVQAPPDLFANPGELDLYQAIEVTLQAHAEASRRRSSDNAFHFFLKGQLELPLTSVGYGVGSRFVHYWITHLMAIGVFLPDDPNAFPERGPTSSEEAARQLRAMAREAALAACAACAVRPAEGVSMHDIVGALLAMPPDTWDDLAEPLRRLLVPSNNSRTTYMRYFVHCARALELVDFADRPRNVDQIQDAKPGVNLSPQSRNDGELP